MASTIILRSVSCLSGDMRSSHCGPHDPDAVFILADQRSHFVWIWKESITHSVQQQHWRHTPSLAFRHPSSKLFHNWLHHWRGTPYLDASVNQQWITVTTVCILRKVWVLIRQWKQHSTETCTQICCTLPRIKTLVPSQWQCNDFGFIQAAESNAGNYRRNAWYNQSCLLQTYCHLCTNQLPDSFWRPVE